MTFWDFMNQHECVGCGTVIALALFVCIVGEAWAIAAGKRWTK